MDSHGNRPNHVHGLQGRLFGDPNLNLRYRTQTMITVYPMKADEEYRGMPDQHSPKCINTLGEVHDFPPRLLFAPGQHSCWKSRNSMQARRSTNLFCS